MFSLNPGTFAQMLTNEAIIMCNIVRGREKGGVMVVRKREYIKGEKEGAFTKGKAQISASSYALKHSRNSSIKLSFFYVGSSNVRKGG